jgi:23S rRNA pseudouridine1911/1915/1917 synthase
MLNRGYAYTTIISSKDHGRTLLCHLASLYPHSTAQAWQQNLNNREVTVDGVTATGSESLTSGQALVWNRPPWVEPETPQHFEVLFNDPHLLAVNKPGGLPTLPGGGFMENTLLRLVQKQTPNAKPVHRLGRATTGIVLFAKTAQAASKLSADWNTPRIQKIYWALAQNVAQHDAYEILTSIGLVPHPRIGSVWAANPSGKPSKSLAKVISRTASTTTFEVSLNSGRPHQIRIHLASIGHPLVGDPLYGLSGQPLENLPGLPGDGGYFLHARFLKFHHPITGEQINLEAALPSGFSLHQYVHGDSNQDGRGWSILKIRGQTEVTPIQTPTRCGPRYLQRLGESARTKERGAVGSPIYQGSDSLHRKPLVVSRDAPALRYRGLIEGRS